MYECIPKGFYMTKKFTGFILLILCFALSLSLMLPACAENGNQESQTKKIQCIAYRGDTAEYEANSKEAVLSAFGKGADFVSVNIRKNADVVLVLCSENAAEVEGVALGEMLTILGEGEVLILDFENELKDEIYELLKEENALSKAYMRIKDSASDIDEWVNSKQQAPEVIGVSSSFNIFTIRGFVKKLSSVSAVQLQSKNYFNVMYGSLAYSLFDIQQGAGVIAPMYDPDLCGQRSDSEDGWNDLIKKNFNVIETNNLEAFVAYRNNADALEESLGKLLYKAEKITAEDYSLVSRENLAKAIETATILLSDDFASCDELQSAYSELNLAVNKLTLKQGEDTQKGALNITAGKVAATVLVGSAILSAQIYTYKMQKDKRRK